MKNVGVINAAVNSMGLLTNDGPPEWHPTKSIIKEVCSQASKYCKVCLAGDDINVPNNFEGF